MKAFQNLPIVLKLLVPLILMGALTVGTSLYALSQMRGVGEVYQGLLRRDTVAVKNVLLANETAAHIGRVAYMMVAEPDSFIIESMADEIDLKRDELLAHLDGVERLFPGRKTDLDLARQDFRQMMELAEKARQALLAGETERGARILVDEFDIKLTDLLDRLVIITGDVDKAVAAGEEAAMERNERAWWVTLAVGATGTVLFMALALWLTMVGVSRPLARVVSTMSRLAGGDLSVRIDGGERRDEIGDTARAVAIFQRNMREAETLRHEQTALEEKAEAEKRAAMAALAGEFEATMDEVVRSVAGAARRMRQTAEGLTGVAEQTSRQSNAVASSAEQAAQNVNTVASAAEELSASIQEIARRVSESSRIAHEAVAEADRSNATVTGLVEAASRIGEVVKLINGIASQTNLLALNATIEAARAGEAGKGFAVVASEVKNLATQTAKATEEIGSQIAEMQAAAGNAAGAIQGVGGTIGRISDIVTSIAAAVEQQGAATSEIAGSVAQAAAGTNEVSATIGEVTRAAGETGTMAGDVLAAANELVGEADVLRREVEGFVARVRAG
ncbi:methyl-accepting chemotaxis protein [Indioceanicola profundi]|uniref:methyl-accepting chemotaxis protein n=1 Tax=Indioceanicola profundi TaxID=2220096 RepID=UPI000E6AA8CB|nr:methyl-accepting chemotaxis protein [Indioceanicola profundi]